MAVRVEQRQPAPPCSIGRAGAAASAAQADFSVSVGFHAAPPSANPESGSRGADPRERDFGSHMSRYRAASFACTTRRPSPPEPPSPVTRRRREKRPTVCSAVTARHARPDYVARMQLAPSRRQARPAGESPRIPRATSLSRRCARDISRKDPRAATRESAYQPARKCRAPDVIWRE